MTHYFEIKLTRAYYCGLPDWIFPGRHAIFSLQFQLFNSVPKATIAADYLVFHHATQLADSASATHTHTHDRQPEINLHTTGIKLQVINNIKRPKHAWNPSTDISGSFQELPAAQNSNTRFARAAQSENLTLARDKVGRNYYNFSDGSYITQIKESKTETSFTLVAHGRYQTTCDIEVSR
jgi:hypothetical protein